MPDTTQITSCIGSLGALLDHNRRGEFSCRVGSIAGGTRALSRVTYVTLGVTWRWRDQELKGDGRGVNQTRRLAGAPRYDAERFKPPESEIQAARMQWRMVPRRAKAARPNAAARIVRRPAPRPSRPNGVPMRATTPHVNTPHETSFSLPRFGQDAAIPCRKRPLYCDSGIIRESV